MVRSPLHLPVRELEHAVEHRVIQVPRLRVEYQGQSGSTSSCMPLIRWFLDRVMAGRVVAPRLTRPALTRAIRVKDETRRQWTDPLSICIHRLTVFGQDLLPSARLDSKSAVTLFDS